MLSWAAALALVGLCPAQKARSQRLVLSACPLHASSMTSRAGLNQGLCTPHLSLRKFQANGRTLLAPAWEAHMKGGKMLRRAHPPAMLQTHASAVNCPASSA